MRWHVSYKMTVKIKNKKWLRDASIATKKEFIKKKSQSKTQKQFSLSLFKKLSIKNAQYFMEIEDSTHLIGRRGCTLLICMMWMWVRILFSYRLVVNCECLFFEFFFFFFWGSIRSLIQYYYFFCLVYLKKYLLR